MTDGAPTPPDEPADPFGLTTREREVLALVAEGYTNRRIADILFISESTAGVHVSHILGKLGVETRTEAAAVAVRLGLDRTSSADGRPRARAGQSRSRLRSAALTRSSSVLSTPTSARAVREASRASASE